MWCSGHGTLPLGAPRRRGLEAPVARMPPSPCIDRAPIAPRRRFLRTLAVLCAGAAFANAALADEIAVASASLRVDEDDVLLSAEFGLALTPALEQALDKGIALYFTIDFELLRTRAFWFPEKVAEWSITYRVAYSSLTRQYRVSSGPLGQAFESLDDVERFIGHVASRPVAKASDLAKGANYEAGVRMKLDVNQLPKPFQLNALASRDWQLASDWYRFDFTP
jgi:hypothetical protein